jgi:hypothetical protein
MIIVILLDNHIAGILAHGGMLFRETPFFCFRKAADFPITLKEHPVVFSADEGKNFNFFLKKTIYFTEHKRLTISVGEGGRWAAKTMESLIPEPAILRIARFLHQRIP